LINVQVEVPDAAAVCKTAVEHKINLRQFDAKTITIALDETTNPADIEVMMRHGP
jgi:glycine cleavage system pyridoxal-binding protein P